MPWWCHETEKMPWWCLLLVPWWCHEIDKMPWWCLLLAPWWCHEIDKMPWWCLLLAPWWCAKNKTAMGVCFIQGQTCFVGFGTSLSLTNQYSMDSFRWGPRLWDKIILEDFGWFFLVFVTFEPFWLLWTQKNMTQKLNDAEVQTLDLVGILIFTVAWHCHSIIMTPSWHQCCDTIKASLFWHH